MLTTSIVKLFKYVSRIQNHVYPRITWAGIWTSSSATGWDSTFPIRGPGCESWPCSQSCYPIMLSRSSTWFQRALAEAWGEFLAPRFLPSSAQGWALATAQGGPFWPFGVQTRQWARALLHLFTSWCLSLKCKNKMEVTQISKNTHCHIKEKHKRVWVSCCWMLSILLKAPTLKYPLNQSLASVMWITLRKM